MSKRKQSWLVGSCALVLAGVVGVSSFTARAAEHEDSKDQKMMMSDKAAMTKAREAVMKDPEAMEMVMKRAMMMDMMMRDPEMKKMMMEDEKMKMKEKKEQR